MDYRPDNRPVHRTITRFPFDAIKSLFHRMQTPVATMATDIVSGISVANSEHCVCTLYSGRWLTLTVNSAPV